MKFSIRKPEKGNLRQHLNQMPALSEELRRVAKEIAERDFKHFSYSTKTYENIVCKVESKALKQAFKHKQFEESNRKVNTFLTKKLSR